MTDSDTTTDNKPWRRGPADALAFGFCWAVYLFMARRFWFLTDDAYISFRYARNWAEGLGLRYNLQADPPVEGFSNFLWVALAALAHKLGLDITTVMPVLSLLCGSALLWALFAFGRRDLKLPLISAAALLLPLAVYPPFAVWSSSGLATMPFALALFLTAHEFLWRRAPRWIPAALLLLCVSLLRAEGVLWSLGILFLALLQSLSKARRWSRADNLALASFVLVYGAYWLWRFSYFGRAWPNTVYAKSGMNLERGANYVLAQWCDAFLPLLLIPLTLLALVRSRERRAHFLFLAAAATAAYSVATGGDFMVMGRFLLPGAALLVAAFAAALGERVWLRDGRYALGLALIASLLSAWPGFREPLLPHSFRDNFHFRWNAERSEYRSEREQWQTQQFRAARWLRFGKAFKGWVPPGSTVVAGAAGAFAYYSGVELLDRNGLVTFLPGAQSYQEQRSPGHDRTVEPDYFLEAKPGYAVVAVLDAPIEPAEPEARHAFANSLERRALRAITVEEWVRQYAPIARPIPKALGPVGEELVLYWQRVPEGADPADSWNAWRRSVERYARTGEWGSP